MLNLRRRAVVPVVLVGLLMSLVACSSSDSSSGSSSQGSVSGLKTVTVQVPPVTGSAIVYLAKEQGLFEKEGLDVQITVGQGGAAIAAALQAGSTNLAQANHVSMISGVSNNLPVQFVTEGTRGPKGTSGLVVAGDSPIQSGADLKGKKIGVVATGSVSDLTTNARLAEFGLTPSDVTYVNVPVANLISSVSSGQVDAVWLDEPITSNAISQGDRLVLDAFDGTTAELAVGGYYATADWAAENPGILKSFTAAIAAAAKVANDDPTKTRAVIPTFTTLTADQVSSMTMPIFVDKSDTSKVQAVSDLMSKYGLLQSPVDVSQHVAAQ